MKRCSKCEQTSDEFHRCTRASDGLQAWCKGCQRRWLNDNRDKRRAAEKKWIESNPDYNRNKRLRSYGLTQEDYDAMLASQEHRCAVCEEELVDTKTTHIDHCHETDKVRGLLCLSCNTAAGRLGDCPDRVQALADYLRLHQGELCLT